MRELKGDDLPEADRLNNFLGVPMAEIAEADPVKASNKMWYTTVYQLATVGVMVIIGLVWLFSTWNRLYDPVAASYQQYVEREAIRYKKNHV